MSVSIALFRSMYCLFFLLPTEKKISCSRSLIPIVLTIGRCNTIFDLPLVTKVEFLTEAWQFRQSD